jgi:hypothetical protein
LLALLG